MKTYFIWFRLMMKRMIKKPAFADSATDVIFD